MVDEASEQLALMFNIRRPYQQTSILGNGLSHLATLSAVRLSVTVETF